MRRTFWGALSVTCALTTAAAAQQAQPRTTQPAQQQKQTPPPAEQATTATPREPAGQPVNVKLELTITDQTAPGEPAKKTLTMIVADRAIGNIRSFANNVRATLNVDATPQLLPNGNIRVALGLEYNPVRAGSPGPEANPSNVGGSTLNERITLVFENGKPLIVSQAADPVSDRKISVEVKATILK
jgi:hypothetical protein